MKDLLFLFAIICLAAAAALAQPRPPETVKEKVPAVIAPAPATVAAKYEGGFFGFTDKVNGTLKFDDENLRLVFLGKDGKELFGIPYDAFLVVSPQSRSVTSTTGNVVRNLPLPGSVLGGFIKEKRSYVIIQFQDVDVDARGTTSFKLENRDLVDSVVKTLGEKGELKKRGDAYFRPRPGSTSDGS